MELKQILEAALLAIGEPISIERLSLMFPEDNQPSVEEIKQALENLAADYQDKVSEIKLLASGYVIQVRQEFSEYLSRLYEERPARYSRAFLETLALIVYRQPITRGEIEKVRGVAVGSNIMKSLLDRNWVRVVGQRDVPGKPSLYATTKEFLDYFGLKSLEELPPLAEIKSLEQAAQALELELTITEVENPQTEELRY